jgi:hypothetical protein
MTVNFEHYGRFYLSLNYIDAMVTYVEPRSLKDCMDLIESEMSEDLTILSADVCDAETGEVVAIVTRDNEDFIDEDWREPDYDECGYNPYMGCYDFDC